MSEKLKIKIKPMDGFIHPKKGTGVAACFDIYATKIVLNETGDKATIHCGFSTEIPKGWKGIIVPRSGQGKTYWTMLNSPGQVDEDYRGEWIVKMTCIPGKIPNNTGYFTDHFPFQVGERFAQIYFERVNEVELVIVDEIEETERGEGGFGSTGKK
jgi:dUTP pyrophosphatase